jgi:hypothetical protein
MSWLTVGILGPSNCLQRHRIDETTSAWPASLREALLKQRITAVAAIVSTSNFFSCSGQRLVLLFPQRGAAGRKELRCLPESARNLVAGTGPVNPRAAEFCAIVAGAAGRFT